LGERVLLVGCLRAAALFERLESAFGASCFQVAVELLGSSLWLCGYCRDWQQQLAAMLFMPAWQCWAASPREQGLVCSSLRVAIVLSSGVKKDWCRAVFGCRAVFEQLLRLRLRLGEMLR
jgi:hypothetical protein